MSLSDLIRSDLKKKSQSRCQHHVYLMTSPCDDGAPCSCHDNDLKSAVHF